MSRIDFAKALNDFLEKKNISKKDLSIKIGTNEFFVEGLLNGEANLTLGIMEKVAKKLGCVLKIEFKEVENE